MSKSRKPQPKKSPARPVWLIPAVFAGVIIVVVAIVALVAGNRRTPFEPEVSGASRASFDQTSVDHGTVRFEQPVESVYRVRNVGDEPLVIAGEPRVELVEGC